MDLKPRVNGNIKHKVIDLDDVDRRTNDFKDAQKALDDNDITKLDLRSKTYKIWEALHDQQYGDAVSHFTSILGIEKCSKCKERQERWNKKAKEELNIDTLEFKEDTILNEDAQLLLQGIWKSHRTKGKVDSALVVAFSGLYYSIYRKRPQCTSCGFMNRFDKVRRL